MKSSTGLLFCLLVSGSLACGGRMLEPDPLCTPPDPETTECREVDARLLCAGHDGTTWERLPSGTWLHLEDDPLRVLCDVAPDGRVIGRSP